jgi:hypothetical protein
MKIKFLALGLLATTASVAGAHVFMPPRIAEQPRPPPMAIATHVSALPGRSTLSWDATRPPVPFFVLRRPPFVPASEAVSTLSPSGAVTEALAGLSATAAKAAIEGDGYKGIRALARGSDGVWRASALRGQIEVQLSVSPTGSVSAN